MDVPTLHKVPQARTLTKPSEKLCPAFKRLRLIRSHKFNNSIYRSCLGTLARKGKKKQLKLSNASFLKKPGVSPEGSPSSTSQVVVGWRYLTHHSISAKKLEPSHFSFYGKSLAHIWRSLQDDDDNVFLLNKIHF